MLTRTISSGLRAVLLFFSDHARKATNSKSERGRIWEREEKVAGRGFLVRSIHRAQNILAKKNCSQSKGFFTWREEDSRRRNNFSFGLHVENSAEVLTKWRRKIRKIIALYQLNARLPPCLFFLYLVLGSSERKQFTWC